MATLHKPDCNLFHPSLIFLLTIRQIFENAINVQVLLNIKMHVYFALAILIKAVLLYTGSNRKQVPLNSEELTSVETFIGLP